MATSTKRKPARRPARARKAARPRRRRWAVRAGLAVAAWLLASHFVVRAQVRGWLEGTFTGDATVGWALLWPTLDATAFSVRVEGAGYELRAASVDVDLDPWGAFGGRPVRAIGIDKLEAEWTEGARVDLFRPRAAVGEAPEGAHDLAPLRVPDLRFHRPRFTLRTPEGAARPVFHAARVDVVQDGESSFRLATGPGEFLTAPFEKFTARLLPNGDHVILGGMKLRGLNGIIGGFLDVDLSRAGAANGELEWHFVEVEEAWRHYDLPYAEKRRGDLSGRLVFEADRPELAAARGQGTIRLERARFYSPVSFQVFLFLGYPVLDGSWITSARLDYSFEEGLVFVESGEIDGGEYRLDVQGIVTIDGEADLEVRHGGSTLAVRGSLDDPRIKYLPVELAVSFDRIFRERIRRRKR